MAVTEYIVVRAADPSGMATQAAAKIAAGYQPSGPGYSSEDNYLCQAFIKGTPSTAVTESLSLDLNTLSVEAGAGITDGVGTVYRSSASKVGGIIKTSILLDLTGLGSSTTDLDIIGTGTSAAHLGKITAANNGTILSGRMTCLEVPVGGADDIDLYSATVATGKFDDGIAALTETAIVTAGSAWTLGLTKAITGIPPANDYLYLCGGEAGTAAAYTAGKFLIEFDGYDA